MEICKFCIQFILHAKAWKGGANGNIIDIINYILLAITVSISKNNLKSFHLFQISETVNLFTTFVSET